MKHIKLFETYTSESDRKPLFVDEHGKNIVYARFTLFLAVLLVLDWLDIVEISVICQ